MWASVSSPLEGVQCLVERGADVNIVNDDGLTALAMASTRGDIEIVRYLIDCGARCNLNVRGEVTPLMLASTFGREEIVQSLLSIGSMIHFPRNEHNESSVTLASLHAHPRIVRDLMEETMSRKDNF